ncbi:uncharacterized protein LOC143295262 isoform X1 [Babylonia areolata]|uniref:uncharacterized protein LOC143295262 isoform X1 n=1 Tax=Babylonia areolata TaxID=304850 RepID=UPI003FCFF908
MLAPPPPPPPPVMAVNGPPNGELEPDLPPISPAQPSCSPIHGKPLSSSSSCPSSSSTPTHIPSSTSSSLPADPFCSTPVVPVSPGKKRVRISDSTSVRVIEEDPHPHPPPALRHHHPQPHTHHARHHPQPRPPGPQHRSYYHQFNSDYHHRKGSAETGSPRGRRQLKFPSHGACGGGQEEEEDEEDGSGGGRAKGKEEEGVGSSWEYVREYQTREYHASEEEEEEEECHGDGRGEARELRESSLLHDVVTGDQDQDQPLPEEGSSSSTVVVQSLQQDHHHHHNNNNNNKPVSQDTGSPFLTQMPSFREANNRILLVFSSSSSSSSSSNSQGVNKPAVAALEGKNETSLFVTDCVTGWPLKLSPSLESRDNPFLPGGDLSREAEDLLSKATIVRDKFYLDQQRQDAERAAAAANATGASPQHPQQKDVADGALPNDSSAHPGAVSEDRVTPTQAAKAHASPAADPHPRENGKASSDGVASPDGVRVVVGGGDGEGGKGSDCEADQQDKDKAKRPKCCVVM